MRIHAFPECPSPHLLDFLTCPSFVSLLQSATSCQHFQKEQGLKVCFLSLTDLAASQLKSVPVPSHNPDAMQEVASAFEGGCGLLGDFQLPF